SGGRFGCKPLAAIREPRGRVLAAHRPRAARRGRNMNSAAILALVRNDIRLYFADRRAVLVGVLVPILIAAFFGYVFGGTGKNSDAGRVPIAVVDEDQSTVSRAITADLTADKLLQVTALDRAAAREQVKAGKQNAAAVFPKSFGEQTTKA